MGNKNSQLELDNMIFDMRLQAKQLQREAARSEKDQKAEELKAKRNLERGLVDNARINAENAIRKKNEALNYHRLAGKMDAVGSRIIAAQRTEEMTKQFSKVVPRMQRVLKSMSPENISRTMTEFERVFEDLDVTSAYMNDSLNSATAVSTPVTEVDTLLSKIASEHGIQVQEQIGEVPLTGLHAAPQAVPEDELKSRFERLR
jgi:charged multivesicular body protein 1